ncbi:glycine cleavage system protein GcvH [Roseomonas sp. SSH11]|uniref:Glycine cleavage system H protein n=1 Tax=Pararoseomonas baculiformis TaxID=2820812 RepID=A0ABS4A8P4_9PROT|nr:glycine cleavage system protein GcvH [Pararoseomonas baculiformis]MBP0443369.1 glycine cleavage system protein GcvH [Pararoseomonas baculiformis]
MSQTRFAESHEWVRLDGETAVVGISDHAQNALGDVVFVDLPEVGREVEAGESVAVVESVKAASDIYAPIAGTIAAVNAALVDNPGQVNSDPMGEGWFFTITPRDAGDIGKLMDADAYARHAEAGH